MPNSTRSSPAKATPGFASASAISRTSAAGCSATCGRTRSPGRAGPRARAAAVLVADELPPSVAAQLDWTRVGGLVCDVGSPTHHTVILARSLGVPAVVGLGGATQVIPPGQMLAIDGTTGEVVVEPTDEALERWRRRAEIAAAASVRSTSFARRRPRRPTASGSGSTRTSRSPTKSAACRDAGAEGIGLYRSEFLLDAASVAATEDAQCRDLPDAARGDAPLPVTIRTFDAGEDRVCPPPRRRPSRALRLARHPRGPVARRAVPHADSRAAACRAGGTLRILLPFVTSSDELRQARALIRGRARDLASPPTCRSAR